VRPVEAQLTFRVRHEGALADLFGQVLGLCTEAGIAERGWKPASEQDFERLTADDALPDGEG
jgi:hypothetical protein